MLTIVGAGMAGLLAARMLRDYDPVIIEKQATIPNNHSAVLRFRTSMIGDILNIPFRKVQMIKSTLEWRNPVADALAYAFKNGGVYRSDRSITTGTVVSERFIAPHNFIEQMARRCKVQCGVAFEAIMPHNPVISTAPMPALMETLNYPDAPIFDYIEGWNIKAHVPNCDAYVSMIVPAPNMPFSRVSITGDELIVECTHEPDGKVAALAAQLLGLNQIDSVEVHKQTYAKIQPIDNDVRKHFIWWATDKYNIYSLGRFATWRPGLLLDDLV